tara:strand:- start:8427 stop:9686 length:1260 start_codon:yes stop_codon:yes gene_type:complete
MPFDYIIIGGGISGLYCLHRLYKKNKGSSILLIDDRDYWGGRLKTHNTPHYEIGGARFNDSHVLLKSLLKEMNCPIYKLPSDVLFLDYNRKTKEVIQYDNVNETFSIIVKMIIDQTKQYPKKVIQQYTLKKWIDHLFQDKATSKSVKDTFGYDSEITEMNAYDALLSFERDFISNSFYGVKNGFSSLCDKIAQTYQDKKQIQLSLHTSIDHIESNGDNYKVYGKTNKTPKTFEGTKVIIACKASQLRTFSILKPIFPLLKHIYNAPLLRIYAVYPKMNNVVWFERMPKIITNHPLRQIIPIDTKSGLIMISYCDGHDIDPFWENKKQFILKKERQIQTMIQNYLKELFPTLDVPKPTYFKTHLWTIGCHHWRPNCDSQKIYNQLKQPRKNIHIVGEAFSQKQAWVEGGLETVQNLVEQL